MSGRTSGSPPPTKNLEYPEDAKFEMSKFSSYGAISSVFDFDVPKREEYLYST